MCRGGHQILFNINCYEIVELLIISIKVDTAIVFVYKAKGKTVMLIASLFYVDAAMHAQKHVLNIIIYRSLDYVRDVEGTTTSPREFSCLCDAHVGLTEGGSMLA